MLPRSPFHLAAMISAAWSGACAVPTRRKLAPGPWVKRCRTLLPPGIGSIWYRHHEEGRAGRAAWYAPAPLRQLQTRIGLAEARG